MRRWMPCRVSWPERLNLYFGRFCREIMPTFAAVDIGSNSCRLKIAKVVAHQLRTLHEDREVTRLGASVFESGLVSPEAMANTIQALKRFQRAVQAHGVDRIRVVGTAAMRDARNGPAFQAWVKAETGWTLETISGLEEGRLIHLGVMAGEGSETGRAKTRPAKTGRAKTGRAKT